MKKTIKKDQERYILKQVYVNDNTLLQYTYEDDKVIISVRFVETPLSGIKEHILCQLELDEFMHSLEDFIQISDDKSAIAIYKKTDQGFQLNRLYHTNHHDFTVDDFMDLEYEKSFPNIPLTKQLIKK